MSKVALIGGRGYTGSEFLKLLAKHPSLTLAFASSTSQAGLPIQQACSDWPGDESFIALSPTEVGQHSADVWVLAVPNGATHEWVDAIGAAHSQAMIVDLSADHRFDDDWVYGLTEHHRDTLKGAKRIANPGCYATGAQIGLKPLIDRIVGTPCVFGVSGYSGAGKKPSPNNDPAYLKDNLIPYRLVNHVHEREISYQLGQRVRFMPHVASFFRGISLTISVTLDKLVDVKHIMNEFSEYYLDSPFVQIEADIPNVRDVQNTPFVKIGGFTVNPDFPNELTIVVVLDNLLKGAASQALQSMNVALELDDALGIHQQFGVPD